MTPHSADPRRRGSRSSLRKANQTVPSTRAVGTPSRATSSGSTSRSSGGRRGSSRCAVTHRPGNRTMRDRMNTQRTNDPRFWSRAKPLSSSRSRRSDRRALPCLANANTISRAPQSARAGARQRERPGFRPRSQASKSERNHGASRPIAQAMEATMTKQTEPQTKQPVDPSELWWGAHVSGLTTERARDSGGLAAPRRAVALALLATRRDHVRPDPGRTHHRDPIRAFAAVAVMSDRCYH